jgi:hypothetical protein
MVHNLLGRPAMMISRGHVAVLLLFAACQKDMNAEESSSALIHTLKWHQAPGNEVNDCHVFKLSNPDPVEINQVTVQFPPGSHHVHIYRSDTPDPDAIFDCSIGIDWLRWHLVLGVQSEEMDWRLPDGLTVPFDANQQLLVQVHWINTTTKPIDGNIKLLFNTSETSTGHVGTIFGVNKQTHMAPRQRKTLTQWCPVPEGGKILALMGHYHGLGIKYAVDTRPFDAPTGNNIYDALDEQTFVFKPYSPAVSVPSGEGLQFECNYYNSRDHDIGWGADTRRAEHCNMSAYYYPAADDALSLFCTQEGAEVSVIQPPATRIAPGTSPVFTLRFNQIAEVATTVKLVSSDPSVLTVPATVEVPAKADRLTFEAKALKSSKVTVTATMGTQARSDSFQIGGLVLSEVFVGAPGATDQRQWVEISNLTDETIDLSEYSLGAGPSDYTATRVQLGAQAEPLPQGLMLPPRGCVVIGGPLLAPSQPAYDQPVRFDPNLPADAGAYGVALFHLPAEQITAETLPYDTLVYGVANEALRAATGQAAPVVPLAPANWSYVRTGEAQWQLQAAPTPKICEVH